MIVPRKWEEIIKLAETMPYGQIIIKIKEKQIELVEYTVQRKPLDPKYPLDDFRITPLT